MNLYVDDFFYMGSSSKMKYVLKVAMMIEFKMKDLGLMKYFLGMEVYQGKTKNLFVKKSMQRICWRCLVWMIANLFRLQLLMELNYVDMMVLKLLMRHHMEHYWEFDIFNSHKTWYYLFTFIGFKVYEKFIKGTYEGNQENFKVCEKNNRFWHSLFF